MESNIDQFSQDVLVSHIELLLNYSNRFYNRLFITRKAISHDIITLLDQALNNYFDKDKGLESGLPSVQYISTQLKLSPRYLSDMLRSLTGLNTQQYIQDAIIEKAKEKLSTTNLSISKIAYELGFEHSQSFSKSRSFASAGDFLSNHGCHKVFSSHFVLFRGHEFFVPFFEDFNC